MLVFNRPEKYFPERDEILERQGAARPHWYVICIVLHPSSQFKIKVVDSWYVRNAQQKKTIIEEASIYLTNLIKIFLELKGKSLQGDIEIEEKHLNIIPSNKQEDKYSCGDFSIEAAKCIIENKMWVKPGKIRTTNYDLGIPKKEISEGDHHGTEYFEADDKRDLIKKEEEDDSKEKKKLKLRLYKQYKTHML